MDAMTGATEMFGPAAVRWGDGIEEGKRAKISAALRDLAKPSRRKRSPAVNHERARALAEGRGLCNLQSPDSEARDTDAWIVRIYYRSMGGEILAMESGRLSNAASSRLCGAYDTEWSGALGAQRFRAEDPAPVWDRARVVVLPSQRGEVVEVSEVHQDLAPDLTPDVKNP